MRYLRKALHDDGVSKGPMGKDVTPEITGVYAWTNDQNNFGVALFGSYKTADGTTRYFSPSDWNIETADHFLDPANGRVSASTTYTNKPSGSQLVAYPNNSAEGLGQDHIERANASAVVQWKPAENVTLTVDEQYTLNDCVRGNCNNKLDVGDLGTMPYRTFTTSQTDKVDEVRFDGAYVASDNSRLDFGIEARRNDMVQASSSTYQQLGDWGMGYVGDIQKYAGNLISSYCLSCLFDDFQSNNAPVVFQGNALDLHDAIMKDNDPAYGNYAATSAGNSGYAHNEVLENVWSAYAQFSIKTQFLNRDANIVGGLRYESTEVRSSALQAVPSSVVWNADNDFTNIFGSSTTMLTSKGHYNNWLPNLDFSVNITDKLIGRFSASKTLARPSFGSLFATTSFGIPIRPTAFGVSPSAATGNPNLLPLGSSNVDFSLEWYYGKNSYVAVDFYNKDVDNFEGYGQKNTTLYGIRDPSSGATGSRSGAALTALNAMGQGATDVNLFTLTALIDKNSGNVANAQAEYQSHLVNGQLPQSYTDAILSAYDVTANSSDPEMVYSVTTPVNDHRANIHGFEFSGQHFFGDTGFGIAGSYTSVSGDVGINVGAAPGTNQFALLGLSNTYNVTFIYDKAGWSGRLLYNWRDKYLAQANRGSANTNPTFVEPFGQLDFSGSYQVTPAVLVTFEALNINKEHLRTHGRSERNLFQAQELDTRYQLGVRYKF